VHVLRGSNVLPAQHHEHRFEHVTIAGQAGCCQPSQLGTPAWHQTIMSHEALSRSSLVPGSAYAEESSSCARGSAAEDSSTPAGWLSDQSCHHHCALPHRSHLKHKPQNSALYSWLKRCWPGGDARQLCEHTKRLKAPPLAPSPCLRSNRVNLIRTLSKLWSTYCLNGFRGCQVSQRGPPREPARPPTLTQL
jgi:hypothetical protein